ncbi:MAG: hypothetical protein ABIP42_07495, partial [Planctomycetota bacterium]
MSRTHTLLIAGLAILATLVAGLFYFVGRSPDPAPPAVIPAPPAPEPAAEPRTSAPVEVVVPEIEIDDSLQLVGDPTNTTV